MGGTMGKRPRTPRRRTRGALSVCAAALGWLMLLAGAAPAEVISVYYPTRGEDTRNRALLEKTCAFLSERLPTHQFSLTELSGADWQTQVLRRPAGLIFLDAAQFIQLESRLRLTSIVSVERTVKGKTTSATGGVLFSKRSASNYRVGDLKGKRLAYVDGNPLAAWLAIRLELAGLRINPEDFFSAQLSRPSDQAVVEAVLKQNADVGAVEAGVLEHLAVGNRSLLADVQVYPLAELSRQDMADLPLLLSTSLYPARLLAAMPGLPADVVREVASTLLLAAPGDLGAEGGANGFWGLPGPMEAARQAMKELRVPPYERYGVLSFGAVLRQYMYWFLGAGSLFVLLGLTTSYVLSLNRVLGNEISERKEAQVSLKQSNERFEHVAACSGDWIWETDADERFTYSSDALQKLLGYSPKDILGKSFVDILSNAEKEKLGGQKRLLGTQEKGIFHRRITLRTADGRLATHDCTAGITRDHAGQITGYRGINRDVTAEARMVSFG